MVIDLLLNNEKPKMLVPEPVEWATFCFYKGFALRQAQAILFENVITQQVY